MKRITLFSTLLILSTLLSPQASAINVKLKLSGGFSFVGPENINRTLRDWEELTRLEANSQPGWSFVESQVSKLRSGLDLDGEILLAVSPNISLGIGAGSSIGDLSEEQTALIIEKDSETYCEARPTKITATPFVFLGYIRFPLMDNWTFFAKGGGGIRLGKIYRQRRKPAVHYGEL